jgi:glucose-1-phosphate adenylyltransferase
MTAAGLIFSNIHDSNIPELTRYRTLAIVPFGCRYRLIDFALSNMVNSNITKVGIVTHNNYQSLMDHIGNGKDWDLARRSGGIKILPPFITAYDNQTAQKLYTTRLEALMGVTNFISRCNEDYIVLTDCDVVCNIDLKKVIAQHAETDADVTVVTKKIHTDEHELSSHVYVVSRKEDGEIAEIVEYTPDVKGNIEVSMNIIVFKRLYLLNAIQDAAAHGYTNIYRDIINRQQGKIYEYAYEGYYEVISSLAGFFRTNMALLDPAVRAELVANHDAPIYTKVRNSPPTRYAATAQVRNSMVADGCVIEGTVENSIIFRGVHVGKGTVVRNCILLQDTYVGSDAKLDCVISDKNVMVKDGRTLAGHETLPFFLPKGTMV